MKDLVPIAPIYGDYLAHHGIKGQKWGIRRYQNDDGTLTEEGKRRYTTKQLKQIRSERRELEEKYYDKDPNWKKSQ